MSDKKPKPSRRRDEIDERTLPANLEAERAVLGAILMHNDAYVQVRPLIGADDFMRDAHRRIFASLERLLDRPNGSADTVTVKNDLDTRGDLEEVGGPAYLGSLADGVPRSTNAAEYARIVREKSLLRQLIAVGNQIVTEAYVAEDTASSILELADQAVVRLQHGPGSSRMRSLTTSSSGLLDRLEYRQAHQSELSGVDTGFPSINDQTLGWQSGDMIIGAARPSIGKTAFILNTAAAAAMSPRKDGSKRHVAIFSLEMRRAPLEDWLLSSLSGVPLTNIQHGLLYDGHWTPLSNAIGQMAEMHIHIDDTASRTVSDIRSECRRLRTEHGLDLAIIDYVQLLSGTLARKGATRNEEITDMSRRIKVLADELTMPFIVLSQLRRIAGARPTLEDLRESGSLEQDADLVAFLHRKDHRASGVTNFILAKQRNGRTGTVNLTFDRDTQLFTDGGEETHEQTVATEKQEDAHAKTRAIIRQRAKGR